MKILFDGPYQSIPKSGVLLYFNLLARELSGSNIIYFSRTYLKSNQWNGISTPKFIHYRPHKLSFFLEYIWFKFFGPNHFDVIHTIEYSLSPVGRYFVKKGAKHVITIYDLIHEILGAPPLFTDCRVQGPCRCTDLPLCDLCAISDHLFVWTWFTKVIADSRELTQRSCRVHAEVMLRSCGVIYKGKIHKEH